jgi:hypothetical protein
MALLAGEQLIADRYVLTDPDTGQTVQQLWYVDDRDEQSITSHGVLDSPIDADGFPSEIHALFFHREAQ